MAEGGFPHSEILGSKLVRSSPRLIAAYHVLHRLSAPRHPPDALKALDRSHDRCPARATARQAIAHTIHGHDKDRQPALSNPLPYACRTHPGRPLSQRPGHIPSSRCQISAASALKALASLRSSLIRTTLRPLPRSAGEGGGAGRDRTDDLMLAKHALSQLSYSPEGAARQVEAKPRKAEGPPRRVAREA